MRLLQVSVRALLMYSLVLVVLSIPVSIFSIRELLNEEVDESLALQTNQFIEHIQKFVYLDDLETDLEVLDQLSYNIHIKPSDDQPVHQTYETISVYDSAEREVRPFRQLSSGVIIKDKPYLLTVRLSLVDNEQLIFAISVVQTTLLVLLSTGLLLLNRSLSRRLWKPFYETLAQLKAYQLDKNTSIHPASTTIVEFEDLNKTVSHLMERNRKVFLQQKEFIENASHELQTPLAIFQGKLDLLMQNPSLTETDATTLSELEAAVQRMIRLNRNLLLLSKIDNEQFLDKGELDIAEIAHELLVNLQPVAELAHISMHISINPLKTIANRALIEILLTNLFHNAIRHTAPGGRVVIELTSRTLRVSNTGQPLKMSATKMFERFSKENSDTQNSGLGLAIVKKITDTLHFNLRYEYREKRHYFEIDL